MPDIMESEGFEKISAGEKKSGEDDGQGRRKRGNRRSFLQKQKRFGKQGRLGRGHEVDGETYGYFVRILELLTRNEFENDEEREIFVENSLTLTEGTEVQLSSNQLVSRVVESILPLASEDSVFKFCQGFTPGLRIIVSDPYASHVLEKLLEVTSSDKWLSSDKLTTWFDNTAKYILNNFEDFTFDKYGSFVMKKVMECLSGYIEPPEAHKTSVFGKKHSSVAVTDGQRTKNFKRENTLKDFAKRFAAWPQFNDLIQRDITSRLMQNVIQSVSRTEGRADVGELIKRVLQAIPPRSEDEHANRILEVCLTASDENTYGLIFDKYFKNHLKDFSSDVYTLPKVISTAPTEEHFSLIFNELSTIFETLLMEEKIGIIHALTEQCVKLRCMQKEFWTLLKDTFAAASEKKMIKTPPCLYESNLIMALLNMGTPRKEMDETEPTGQNPFTRSYTYHGAQTVQALLDFDKPSGVLKCLSELETDQLKKIALDVRGSFVLTKFFKSTTIPIKQKQKLFGQLTDLFLELATTKFGSRIMDDIWKWADIPQKAITAEILGQKIPQLSANRYGKFLVENCGLHAFKKNRKEWTEYMSSQGKKAKELLSIAAELGLSTPAGASKTEKRKVDEEVEYKSSFFDTETKQEADSDEDASPKKKRKSKTKEPLKSDDEVNVDDSEDVSPKKKKSKKSKKEQAEENVQEEEQVEQTRSKKKNKRKEHDTHAENEDMEIESTEVPSEKKKKKKRDKSSTIEANDDSEETPPKRKKSKKKVKDDD